MNFDYPMFVVCAGCAARHYVTDVKIVNVEEDIEGADVVFFQCARDNRVFSSRVFRGVIHEQDV